MRLLYLVFVLVISCNVGIIFPDDNFSKVRTVVNNAFKFAFDRRYDSLSLIMPDFYFKGVNESDMSIKFKDLERSMELGDLPTITNTKVFS